MEDWQQKHITKNLSRLIEVTEFNSNVKAHLLATHILSKCDVEELDAIVDRKGNTAACYKLYELLFTRSGAYEVLVRALEANKQTGAVRLLLNGLQTSTPENEFDNFKDAEIDVQGTIFKINEFFPSEKIALIHQIFKSTISIKEFHDAFVTKENKFVLAIITIPPEPPLYIPRFLSNRIEIDESIFKNDCSDVFVFRNTIERAKLSEIAKPYFTATSTSQLANLTARFIYLEDYEDWIDMKKLTTKSIHLIGYNATKNEYILEDTTASLDILQKIGSQKQHVYMSEDEFVEQQLLNDLKASIVCICDMPGMGKTLLLASIARRLAERRTKRIAIYVQLSTFVAELFLSSGNKTVDQETAHLNVFKYISPSLEHAKLLHEIVKAKLLEAEIFFDGFDEIPSDKVEWMKQVLLSLKSKLTNVQIYVTSRPHMRHELEKSLNVICYEILPFNIQNQVNFLVQFWSPNAPDLDHKSLQIYAKNCLEEINQTLTESDKEMAGIPLLCRLIAEIYAKKVQFFAKTKKKYVNLPTRIAAMYQQFIEARIKSVTKNDDDFDNLKSIHIWHALKLLFPTDVFLNDKIFAKPKQNMSPGSVLRAGILHLQSNEKFEFLHRTFAEYFVADYFVTKLKSTIIKPRSIFSKIFIRNEVEEQIDLIVNQLVVTSGNQNVFVNSVITSFVDFTLIEALLSQEIMKRVSLCFSNISNEKFFSILCSCCHHDFYNLFILLREVLSKWNLSQKRKYFTSEKCFELLSVCIKQSSSQIFQACIQILLDVLYLDVGSIAIYDTKNTLLHRAAEVGNYEAVEYFLDRTSVELPTVLVQTVLKSSSNDLDMIKRKESILQLLLKKCPQLIIETPNVLSCAHRIHLKLFKTLAKLGANLRSVDNYKDNCVMSIVWYTSPSDFNNLVQFLLTDCKAEHLFLKNKKWNDPMPFLIGGITLLPETLELLLKIPGMDINMKDKNGENLLFSAVYGSKKENFKQLVKRGLDYNARGWKNRSLLHVAAEHAEVEMVRYLLSLKLNPNSRNEDQWTPLHYAAKYRLLGVVEVLVENGANVHAKNKKGETALHLIAAEQVYLFINVIVYLIGKGIGVNDRDYDGNTALHLCNWKKEKRDCLIEMGADIHARNKQGKTPAQMDPDLYNDLWSTLVQEIR